MKGLQRFYLLYVDRLGITKAERSLFFLLMSVLVGLVLIEQTEALRPESTPFDYSELEAVFEARFTQMKADQDAFNARFYPHLFVSSETEASAPQAMSKAAKSKTAPEPLLVNVNTADIKELSRLPGIGEKTAQLILEHRIQHGAFKQIKDLEKVKGIGPKKLDNIKDYIVL